MKLARRLGLVAAVVVALAVPERSEATVSISPAISYNGSFTVSWTDNSSGAMRGYIAERVNGGSAAVSRVTGSSKAYTGKGLGAYGYSLQVYVYDAELRREEYLYETNVATIQVTNSMPGIPGPVVAPDASATGAYSVSWGLSAGAVERYELYEGSTLAQSGNGLTASFSAKPNGSYAYKVRACNALGCSAFTGVRTVLVELSLTETLDVGDATPLTERMDIPAQGWVGAIPGTPSVDGGAARYRVDIEVPPGREGMQPGVSLSYNSRSGNGIAGVGWALEAGSSIYRCPRTLEQDDANRPVLLDSKDRLCFNGQRLVTADGAHGFQGSTYRTEVESFDRIRLMGATYSSPASYFIVEHKSGRSSRYEARPSTGTTPPATWHLVSEQDPQGNCVAYSYQQQSLPGRPATDQEWVLSSIAYTGTTSVYGCTTGTDARRVEFEYTQDRKDKRTTYRAGVGTALTSRLSAVVTKVGQTVVRRYDLTHRESLATGRSLLTQITVSAYSGTSLVSLPATKFTYQEDAPSFQFESVPPPIPGIVADRVNWHRQRHADFDGDGTLDADWTHRTGISASERYLESSADGVVVQINDALAALPDAVSGLAGSTVDLDGDGSAEFLATSNGQVYLGHLRRKAPESAVPVTSFDWTWAAQIPTEACPPVGSFLRKQWIEGGTVLVDVYATASNCASDHIYASVEDRDGDGRPDLRFHLPKPIFFGGRSSNGLTLDVTPGHPGAPPASTPTSPLWGVQAERDYNGDGTIDTYFERDSASTAMVQEIAVTTGSLLDGTFGYQRGLLTDLGGPASQLPKYAQRRWLDVNGDGLPDIFTNDSSGWGLWINLGGAAGGLPRFRRVNVVAATTALAANWNSNRAHLQILLDINGDGQEELLVPTTRVPGFEACAFGGIGAELQRLEWCGDFFDVHSLQPDISLDTSVFNWTAHKFQEQLDGTFVLALLAVDLLQAPANVGLSMADSNGDGMADVEFRLDDDQLLINVGWYESLIDKGLYRSRNKGKAPDLMTSVTDGVLSTSAWRHLPLSRGLETPANAAQACTEEQLPDPCHPCNGWPLYRVNRDDEAASRGYTRFTSSMWVAARFDQDTGVGEQPTSTTCYRYEDAVLQTRGRGFQGFKKIISEERLPRTAGEPAPSAGAQSVNNLRVTTEFNQEFPFTNMVRHVTVERVSDGAKLQESSQWWSAVATASGTRLVYPAAGEERKYDLANSTLLSTATTISEIDPASGAAQRTCGFVRDDYAITVSRETLTLSNDVTAWWLGRVDAKESVKDSYPTTWASLPILANWAPTTTAPPACPTGAPSTAARIVRKSFEWYPDSDPARRKLKSEGILQPGSTLDEARNTYTYSGYGGVQTRQLKARAVFDGAGILATQLTTYGYGSGGYFVESEQNQLGQVATTFHDPATGRPTQQQPIQGGPTTVTAYDPFGRVLRVATTGAAPAFQRLSAWGGTGCGNAALVRTTLQAGAPTRTEYLDRLGRVIETRSTSFSGREVVSTVEFNARGKKVGEQAPRYADATAVYETRYENLDALNRVGRKRVTRDAQLFTNVKAAEAPTGEATQVTDYEYVGLTTRIHAYKAGAGGNPVAGASPALEMSRTYDSRGLLRETRQLIGRSSVPIVTSYAYDPAGSPTQLVVAGGPPLAAEYDYLGRKTKVTDPDRGIWTFTWDGLGRLLVETDGRGARVRQEYDVLGRTKERFATPAAANAPELHVASWEYDGCLPGALCREQGFAGGSAEFDRTYKYDPLRRPYLVSTTVKADDASQWRGTGATRTFVTEHGYDRRYGRVKARRLRTGSQAVGETVVIDYNGYGFLLGETEWKVLERVRGTRYRLVTAMSPRGQVESQLLGNGVVEDSTFDASTGLALDLGVSNSSPTAVRHFAYRYDHFLNLSVQDRQAYGQERLERYGYDDLQRLVSARRCTGAYCVATGLAADTESFSYDDLGNLTSKSDYAARYVYGTGIQGGAGPHAVARVESPVGTAATTFQYDGNGNMTSASGTAARTVGFDAMNRAVRVCTSATGVCTASLGTQTEFAYTPGGGRYREKVSGADPTVGPRTVYSMEKAFELVAWSDLEEERFYLGPSVMVVSRRTAPGTTRAVRYLHLDRLGSVEAVTDATGAEYRITAATEFTLPDSHGYDAWGAPRKGDWTSSGGRHHLDDRLATTDRGFTGHELLDGHGLIHMNGRVYDYRLGRFLSVDPIISNPLSSQSINPYSYIGNNPLSGTDPTGYTSEPACGRYASCTVYNYSGNHVPTVDSTNRASAYASQGSGAFGQSSAVATNNPVNAGGPKEVAISPATPSAAPLAPAGGTTAPAPPSGQYDYEALASEAHELVRTRERAGFPAVSIGADGYEIPQSPPVTPRPEATAIGADLVITGGYTNPEHKGVDIRSIREPVLSMLPGVVTNVVRQPDGGTFGYTDVTTRLPSGGTVTWRYGHIGSFQLLGAEVGAGAVLGYTNLSGTNQLHLHLQRQVGPLLLLQGNPERVLDYLHSVRKNEHPWGIQ